MGEKKWYVRRHSISDSTFVVELRESPWEGDITNKTTRELEKVLNREFPQGKKRRHDLRKTRVEVAA